MATLVQLRAEAVWRAQYVPAALNDKLIVPLRAYYSLGPAAIGAPGDENHLYGRHRSANWDRQSVYCTKPEYGTTDGRDKIGDQDWYRAVDVGITGQTLYDACRRLDELVRSGGCPGVAEWFGTYDGKTVVGWFQGHASSSDSSHLRHLHVGFWNKNANDPATMAAVYDAITGDEMDTKQFADLVTTLLIGATESGVWDPAAQTDPHLKNMAYHAAYQNVAQTEARLNAKLAELEAKVEALEGGTGGGSVSHEELVQAAFEGAQKAEDE